MFGPKRILCICITEVTCFPHRVYISTWIIVLAASQRAWVAEATRAAAEIRPWAHWPSSPEFPDLSAVLPWLT